MKHSLSKKSKMQERSSRLLLLRAHREQSLDAPSSPTDQQSEARGREVTHTRPWVSTLHPAPSNHHGTNSSSSTKALFFLSFSAGGTGDYCGNFPIVSQYLHVKSSDGILSQRPTTQTFTGTRRVEITVTLSSVATEKKKRTNENTPQPNNYAGCSATRAAKGPVCLRTSRFLLPRAGATGGPEPRRLSCDLHSGRSACTRHGAAAVSKDLLNQ